MDLAKLHLNAFSGKRSKALLDPLPSPHPTPPSLCLCPLPPPTLPPTLFPAFQLNMRGAGKPA